MEPAVYNLVCLLEGLRGLFCTRWKPWKALQGRKTASFNRQFLLAAGWEAMRVEAGKPVRRL